MKVIQYPEQHTCSSSTTNIFIAGGLLVSCNWQREMVDRFKTIDNLVLFNPRSLDFSTEDPSRTVDQIEWEREHIRKADAAIFWFPYEGSSTSALLQLGRLTGRRPVFVGCHPAYKNILDVKEHMAYNCPSSELHTEFSTLVEDTMLWINQDN